MWLRNNTIIGNGSTFSEASWNCDNQTADLGIVLCNHDGFIGPWIISAIISDGVQDVYMTWYVSYEVWHPPEPVVEDDKTEDSSSEFDVTTNQMIFLGLGVLIVILLVMLVLGGKKPPKAEQSMFADPRYEPRGNQYSTVPGAPSLPPPPGAFSKW